MYARDPQTNVVINTDDAGYRSIVIRRQMQRQISQIVTELNAVKAELAAIKRLITTDNPDKQA